jgi:hypothetical protein
MSIIMIAKDKYTDYVIIIIHGDTTLLALVLDYLWYTSNGEWEISLNILNML